MSGRQPSIEEEAIRYCELGWHVVPLREKSKAPWLKAWQTNASCDPIVVEKWFEQQPNSNIGVALGQLSGIVDLEGDEDASEADFVALFGGDPPVCPTFTAHRGKHRLFKWREDLPGGACIHIGALELRTGNDAKGAQSVFPPSLHEKGIRYEWLPLCSPFDLDPPELPDSVVAKLWNLAGEKRIEEKPERKPAERSKLYTQRQILEGERDNVIYSEACALWGEQHRLHGFQAFERPDCQTAVHQRLLDANTARCKPPLDDAVILQKCNGARTFIMEQVMDNDGCSRPLTSLGLEFRDGEWWPGVWRIESINSDPPQIKIYAPFLPEGVLQMPLEEFDSPTKVHKAVYAATRAVVCLDDGARGWTRLWNGHYDKDTKKARRGLKAKLSDKVKLVEAPEETKRAAFIAGVISAYLDRAAVCEISSGPPTTGRAFRDTSGGIWFKFDHLKSHIHMRHPEEKVTRLEISRAIRDVGAESKQLEANGREVSRERWFVIKASQAEQLRAIGRQADLTNSAPI